MGRSTDNSGEDSFDFESSYVAATAALEESVHELLAGGWDESRRRHAHGLASTLAAAAREAGWKETTGVLDAIASLLALPLDEVLAIRDELRDKLLELLDLLREDPMSETA